MVFIFSEFCVSTQPNLPAGTSLVEYETDKDSVFVYSATASLDLSKFNTEAPNPCINEFHWGSVEPSVEIRIKSSLGYQAMPISVDRAFSGK